VFKNRVDAGQRLAVKLLHLRGQNNVVLGLPRGGVPVAAEVARVLEAPLDVIVVRKLGVPSQPELGMGAIGEDGVRIINYDVIRLTGATDRDVANAERRERVELDRRVQQFRKNRPRLSLVDRNAIIIDDGIATGSTAKAACQVARMLGAARVILATPVAPVDWTERLANDADEFVCVQTPKRLFGVAQWYHDFSQTTDEEVVRCLSTYSGVESTASYGGAMLSNHGKDEPMVGNNMHTYENVFDGEVDIPIDDIHLQGHLTIPQNPRGIVVFAHGSGSSRFSPRNRFVASVMHRARIGTLLFDLLTTGEERHRSNVFAVELLGDRLIQSTRWLRRHANAANVPIGYFGASTGAAAALWAAGDPYNNVDAVVSRGGRPDLTGPRLAAVTAPTLLIVGGLDYVVVDFNYQSSMHLHCENKLAIVQGATHLFEEEGTLAEAAELARDWFIEHFDGGQVAGERSATTRSTSV
jgi:putative phosphoribosyl transferase